MSSFARVALVIVVALIGLGPAATPARALSSIPTVPKAQCQSGDLIETGLQGQVPWPDRVSGRAARGYNCNLKLVGGYRSVGHISLDTYRNCAYYPDTTGGGLTGDPSFDTGTIVLDVTDPAHPVKTDYLTTHAMGGPWESLRVNNRRGLLVADHNGTAWLDVYDIATDCRHPKLLSTTQMPKARGHEGWFRPDGLIYFMSNIGTVTPVDLTDPTHPLEIVTWTFTGGIHGGSTSEDGTRGYFAQTTNPDSVIDVDLSDLAPDHAGRGPDGGVVSVLPLPDNAANQSTYPLNYNGHPYVISFGELTNSCTVVSPCPSPVGPTRCPAAGDTNFDYPRMVDMADEQHPRIVAKFQNEVDDPVNCPLVQNDNSPNFLGFDRGDTFGLGISYLFIYDAHMCSPDRLHNPTILACAQILSGVRVYDIRDPTRPRELAYVNMGTVSATDTTIDRVGARPVVRSDLGQIWWVSDHTGFHVAQFENGVWPFKDAGRCPLGYDYYQQQYDLGYDACLAASGGTGASAASGSATGGASPASTLPFSAAAGRPLPWPLALLATGFAIGLVPLLVLLGRRRRA